MRGVPESLNTLIKEFSKLPGIGKKTAERLAIFILRQNKNDVLPFSKALLDVKNEIQFHDVCHCFMEKSKCVICSDSSRNPALLCIIKDPTDIFMIEKTGFNGCYHSIGGLISPLDGVEPDMLNFASLLKRLENFEELIIALEPSTEGDATSSYLLEILKDVNIKVSRLARGVPVGSSFDYIDEVTLTHSLEDRIEYK
tara:strand:- start:246 stop:839 length:594 start_codon:yes stop_codon:yes gene_type:complete